MSHEAPHPPVPGPRPGTTAGVPGPKPGVFGSRPAQPGSKLAMPVDPAVISAAVSNVPDIAPRLAGLEEFSIDAQVETLEEVERSLRDALIGGGDSA